MITREVKVLIPLFSGLVYYADAAGYREDLGLNPFVFRAGLLLSAIGKTFIHDRLNPFVFRAGLLPKDGFWHNNEN